jgi:RNA polymerase sigma factor (sigma-70 family)
MTHGHVDQEGVTDSKLAVAASRGDDAAFATLYGRYAPRIEGYLARLLGDRHLAEDVTHEVFVSALRRLRDDRPPIAFGPWLFRIARNAAIDVHRRAQLARHVPLGAEQDELGFGGVAPEDAAESRHRLSQLLGALDGLSEAHRNVLVLRELEGLTNGEIAERLGVSRPAVEALLFRARVRVRREYDELISGRRCTRVRRALDSARDGNRLGRRELDVAARHLRSCRDCRRHAWEAGVTALVVAEAPTAALLPLPALAAALAGRGHELARNLLVPWSAGPPAVAPWGRALAVVGVLALGGAGDHRDTAEADAAIAAAPVAALASPAAVPVPLAPRHRVHRVIARPAAPAPPRPAAAPAPAPVPAPPRVPPPAAPPRPVPAAEPPHRRPAPAPRPVTTDESEPALIPRIHVNVPPAAASAGPEGASVRVAQTDVEVPPPE